MTRRTEVLQLVDLAVGYAQHHHCNRVAEHLCATVRGGTLTALLGPNGAGKSTLLRTLSGFQPPLSGEVRVLGRPLGDYRMDELARTVSVVLTEKCRLQQITVRDLVGMGRSPYTGFWGRMQPEDRRIVDESIEMVGIGPLSRRQFQTLSDGERQKVMIAKALAQQTSIILLDEPSAFLDYPSKVEVMQLLHRLASEWGKTIFLSTHDVELSLQLADCVWLLSRDYPLRIGTPEDLILEGEIQRFFQHRDVWFDSASGMFRIQHEERYRVALQGDEMGIRRDMLVRALGRNGMGVAEQASRIVELRERSFLLHLPRTRRVECATIGEVLMTLLDDFETTC